MTLDSLRASLAGHYRIERELGAGGMATVYLALDLKHHRQVAIKVLRPELAAVIGAERFLAEIRTTANLQHPHILPLHDSGDADGALYYVMPYVDGVSLRDRIVREHQLPVDDTVRIASEVADALHYAHRHGIIHRDIKPENILLQGGHALVADFGIALAASKAGTRMTETGMSLGTPHYMSPEQAMGEREITAASDVYALGCVTYEMLIGEPPFTGPTAQAIVARVMTEEPRNLAAQRRSIPPHVEAAVLRALEKLPADRFATAAQFGDALQGNGPAIGRATARHARHRQTMSDPWRTRAFVAAAVAVIAVAVAIRNRMTPRSAAGLVTRSYISFGDSAALQVTAGYGPSLAIAPDGDRIAFVGDSQRRIWIKRRDALDAVPIPGTEHAASLTFSPDGAWIGYLAGMQVRKVAAAGGASVTIADSAAASYGLTWLDDGTLVYTDHAALGLRRVNAGGGPVSQLIADSVFHGFAPMLPTPLPRGRGILFLACASSCLIRSHLYVLDFNTGREKLLFDNVGMAWYLPTGDLLYVRLDGVALAVPFDLRTLEPHGTGVPVVQGIAVNAGILPLAWSRSGTLVYVAGEANAAAVTLQSADRSGAITTLDSAWHGDFNSFAMAPDGRRAAVGATTPGGGMDIWIKELRPGGSFTRLTFSGEKRRPAWSPDARTLAFVHDSGNGGDVHVVPADGSGTEHMLVHLDRAVQEVAWSRDGRLLVRTETSAHGAGDILAVRTADDSVVAIAVTPFTETEPAMSPDGRYVAFTSNESSHSQVYVRPSSNSGAARWQVSVTGGGSPVWSADGKELYFVDDASHLMAAQLAQGPIFRVTALHSLFDASRFDDITRFHQVFDVTRDGRFVFLGPASPATAARINMVRVDDWFADLKAKVGR